MRLIGEPKGKIEKWGEAYATLRIVGFLDGKEIITSRVVDVDIEARRVLTRSGSIYELGEPHTESRDIDSIKVPR